MISDWLRFRGAEFPGLDRCPRFPAIAVDWDVDLWDVVVSTLVETMTFNQRVVGSTPALAAT